MIKYLIVDDEHIAHDIIKGYCDLLPNMKLMKNCYDALEAFEYLNKNQVDLIFLDLNMPKLKGFEFLKTLPSPPKVIVTTAYKEYALEGYELNISDYLLKPFGFERFLKAVNKAVSTTTRVQPPTEVAGNSTTAETIFLHSNKKYIQVVIDTIQYMEAAGNYTKVITTTQTITVREKISDLLESLPKDYFLQVHKSFAVAVKHIKSIEGNRISIGNDVIPIGKIYKTNIIQLLK
ncbi:DNA-binding LytR/AlgR family response regulator [Aquimarina sp. EL_43]|uniref:LytR/AlgR family response regulator transcription factor n=1 Tax=unclassified Aquimarina TaxID=2627091 RepID=UPI0018CAD045|nr:MULTISPECIES: response regulator transcription factor [unclassified Aquimarina]MBG6129587.1 DNA-binding LytR/AlgR family response regulator [Aquimarina sp. EL_35]MBG6150652.1 DNA-binding LytR/AlgR family response regulator [Aquimarina sp. EL_32]MBG6168040.1 DNA-binding LytR/AlgR family response regulator [Aquimarina sp. EL_43]